MLMTCCRGCNFFTSRQYAVALIDWRSSSHSDVRMCPSAGTKMSDFRKLVNADLPAPIAALASDVEEFAKQFPTIGFEKASMRYKD